LPHAQQAAKPASRSRSGRVGIFGFLAAVTSAATAVLPSVNQTWGSPDVAALSVDTPETAGDCLSNGVSGGFH